VNDADADLARAGGLSRHAHPTVFTGLFYRDQIRDYFRSVGLPDPYEETTRRIFPEALERGVLTRFRWSDPRVAPCSARRRALSPTLTVCPTTTATTASGS
jgi:hypothetical protein